MRRVLFVDDEPNVLAGLQRMLRPLRDEWSMAFVGSGKDALATLEKERFDVVVSDMKMPDMHGAELLTQIRDRYPNVVRIALSGHSEREMILRSVGPTHFYLAKPCDADTLKHAVARALALRDLVAEDSLQQLVAHISALPSMPALYTEIVEELQSEDGSVKRVGDIISKDVGMTAKVLQLVNSAFFGLRRHVSAPAQAVSLLGLETVKALVLSVHVFSQLDSAKVEGFSLDRLWQHSTATGTLAKKIAADGELETKDIDHTLMAGLLHDVGKLVLAANVPEPYNQVLATIKADGITQSEAEYRVLGATHADLGAYLLGLWGLPHPIVETLAFHHRPDECLARSFAPLTAVHIADALEQEAYGESDGVGTLNMDYVAGVGVADRIDSWRDLCTEVVGVGDAK